MHWSCSRQNVISTRYLSRHPELFIYLFFFKSNCIIIRMHQSSWREQDNIRCVPHLIDIHFITSTLFWIIWCEYKQMLFLTSFILTWKVFHKRQLDYGLKLSILSFITKTMKKMILRNVLSINIWLNSCSLLPILPSRLHSLNVIPIVTSLVAPSL